MFPGVAGSKSIVNLLYIFSLTGFFLAPAKLGRWIWLLPLSFLALNAFLFFAPEALQPRENIWIYVAVSQAPWILFGLDLIAKGKISFVMVEIPLPDLILWPLFRLMGIILCYSMYIGDLPPDFAFRAAFGDVVAALGALILWTFYRPHSTTYRALLLFWNSYGFITALSEGVTLLRAHPGVPFAQPDIDLHGYFSTYPLEWIPLFWIPLSLCVHAAIFYKLYGDWKEMSGEMTGQDEAS